VYGSKPGQEPNGGKYGVPWRTLLFRASLNEGHVGAPSYAGGSAPADHYFMDLYWMPVVEPYPMSVNYSTAGKINLNWQLLPFSHIRRETALRAAIKGETVATISQSNVANSNKQTSKNPSATYRVQYKQLKSPGGKFPLVYWSESDGFYWNRTINVPETLRQLEERFTMNPGVPTNARGLMRTASQLCELHLIPESSGTSDGLNPKGVAYKPTNRTSVMNTFWGNNKLTGDNSRERAYTNIYQKVSTKSNTYRVHFIAQSILKAISIAPSTVDTGVDTVTSTYRGSALIERYLPTTISGAPIIDGVSKGVAPSNAGTSLEKYHRYKILEMKQFIP
jgi:uncharacterized protein (TIGR02600 family)